MVFVVAICSDVCLKNQKNQPLVFGSGEMVPSGDSWMYPESQRTPMGNPYISPILTWVFMVYDPQESHPRNSQLFLDARCLVSLICSIKLQWFATTLTYEEGWFGLWPVSSVNAKCAIVPIDQLHQSLKTSRKISILYGDFPSNGIVRRCSLLN